MKRLADLSIAAKVLSVVGLLCLVAGVIGWLGIDAMRRYEHQVGEMQSAMQRAVLAERINGQIFSVVMDSRGIYMARTVPEAEKFGKPLVAMLKLMQETMGKWAALMPPERRAETDAAAARVDEFVKFRSELFRLAREDTLENARAYGDNDANRANRSALNKEIQTLAERNNADIAALGADLEKFYSSQMTLLIGVAVVGIGIALVLSLLTVTGSVVRPIRRLTATMRGLAEGDTAVEIAGADRRNELGDMSRAVAVFKDSMLRNAAFDEERRRQADESEARRAALEMLTRDFTAKIGEVSGAVAAEATEMEATAQSMSSIADEANRQATIVAAAAEEATANVQTVASAAEELSASISEIGHQVSRSSDIAAKAVEEAARTNATVQSLSDAAQKIGEVVGLIQDIASQTNLLALNATIEAARAGEAGKGFSVVASEVKSLANQTARATEDIASQIGAIQNVTREAVGAIHSISSTISEISQISTAIAAAVDEQGAATRGIAESVTQAAQGTNGVSANITGVTRTSGEVGAAAQDVLGTAADLAKQSERLTEEVSGFVSALTAA